MLLLHDLDECMRWIALRKLAAPMQVTGESHFTGCGAEAGNPALARTCETFRTI
jgi:hypothetical protein